MAYAVTSSSVGVEYDEPAVDCGRDFQIFDTADEATLLFVDCEMSGLHPSWLSVGDVLELLATMGS